MSTVNDIIKKKGRVVVQVSPETSVFDAISIMAQHSAGSALVMDNDKLVGIMSERDFIRKAYLPKRTEENLKTRDIMTANVIGVTLDESVESCMNMMTEKRIRHLPVVENGKVVAVISIGDIVKFLINEKDFVIKNLENYISGAAPA